MWAATPDDVKVDYGDTYYRAFLNNMTDNLRYSSKKTYHVIDDLVHAVTSIYPYRRYVPSLKIKLITDLFYMAPQNIQDYAVMRTTGVNDCVPFSMRTKKSV